MRVEPASHRPFPIQAVSPAPKRVSLTRTLAPIGSRNLVSFTAVQPVTEEILSGESDRGNFPFGHVANRALGGGDSPDERPRGSCPGRRKVRSDPGASKTLGRSLKRTLPRRKLVPSNLTNGNHEGVESRAVGRRRVASGKRWERAPDGPCGVWEAAWGQGSLGKAGKDWGPAWSTREGQGRPYKRSARNRGVDPSQADTIPVGEESTRGRLMVPVVVASASARGRRPRRDTRRLEPTR